MSKEIPSPELRKKMADIFSEAMGNFRYSFGAREFEKILKIYPNEEAWWGQLAMLYDHLAIFRKPSNRQKALRRKKIYETKAKKACYKAIGINPDSMWGYEGLARIYWHNKNKKGIYFYKKAYDISKKKTGNGGYNSMNLANAYLALEKYKDAEKYFLEYLKYDPVSFGIFHNLTDLYIKLKNKKKACYYLQRARKALENDRFIIPNTKAYEVALRHISLFEEQTEKI